MKKLLLIFVCIFGFSFAGDFAEFEDEYQTSTVYDPLYKYNKAMHNVNKALFNMSIRPAAQVYDALTFPIVKKGISNVYDNLCGPLKSISFLLSGEGKAAARSFGRFLLNSIVGLGGLIKIAPDDSVSDFGLMAARWHIGAGPHIEVPLLGPSNLRDLITTPFNMLANPISFLRPELSIAAKSLDAVQVTAKNKKLIDQAQKSLDSYVISRDWYEKTRKEQE